MHMPAGSGPAATAVQFPFLPATAQERQLPHGPLEQQTPSVQRLLRQSAAALHGLPSGFRLVQEPDWQVSPLAQSLSLPHIVRQALALQR
jgi:hypothetical protein